VPDPSTRAQVAREVLDVVPPDEGTPWFYESLVALVTTGSPTEHAAAITRRTAVASAVMTSLSGHRDLALVEPQASSARSSEIARSLGLSPAWTQTLLRRRDRARQPGRLPV